MRARLCRLPSRHAYRYRLTDVLADIDALGKPGYETEPEEVARQAMEWLTQQGINEQMMVPLTGSSVHFDKGWLDIHMPNLAKWFSYRTIDASGMREYGRVVAPELIEKIDAEVKPRKEHRPIPDIMDSVDLFTALRKHGVIIS